MFFSCDLFFFLPISILVSYISFSLPQKSLLCNSSVHNDFHLFVFLDSFAACEMFFLNYVFVVVVLKQELKQKKNPTEYKIKFLSSVLYLYSSLSKLISVI